MFAIDEAFQAAQKRALAGDGPSLIECKTYRWMGHWTGDPQVYRTREEVASWREKCPIKRFRKYLLENGILSDAELTEIEDAATKEAADAAEFAMNSPEPDPAHVLDDVFAD